MRYIIDKILGIYKNKEARALLNNFIWLSTLKVMGYIFPLLTLPYLSKVIGVDSFGELAFATSVIVFIETFVDFGFNYTATRDIARVKYDVDAVSKIFSNVLWSKLVLMVFGFFVLCCLIYTIPSLYDKRLLLILTFLYIPGHIIFPDWFFQAMEKMKYITVLNVLSKTIFTLLIFVVIKNKSDYIYQPLLVAAGYIVSGLISLCYIFIKFGVYIRKPSVTNIFASIKGSWNMFLSLIFPNLYTNFSTILLRTTCGEVATGLYDAGCKFINMANHISQILSRTFFPFLARRIDKHKMYVMLSGSICLLFSIVIYISADWLVELFYTSDFEQATIVIKIMAISPIGLFLMDTYGTDYLVIVGKENIYKNITMLFSSIGFLLSIIIVPKYGYIGMAITVTSARLVGGGLTYVYASAVKSKIRINKVI